MDTLVIDFPLSVVYAAVDSVKRGFDIRIIDLRLEEGDWRNTLSKSLEKKPLLVGVSVMTGTPLHNAREISTFIKNKSPETSLVWGGPHPTVLPETINEPYLDYIVRGYGSFPLAELISHLKNRDRSLSEIKGLSYKHNGQIFHNPRSDKFEMPHFRDLPYRLIEIDSPKYIRSYSGNKMFPIFTSIGCPYRCAFCVHPTIYKVINGAKWRAYEDEEIIGHIEYIIKNFHASHFVILDDTSFPDLKRMRRIFEKILARHINITLEFRGARIDELDRMDDDFLNLMVKAGVRLLLVGVESGSDRVLKSLLKGFTKEQILRVNRKLARHPQITAHYNFIYGCPGETYDDLVETKNVVLQLLEENPNVYFGFGGDWKPIPGTKTLEIAEKEYSYRAPKTIDDWIQIDSSDFKTKIVHPWYTRRHDNLIKLLQISAFVIDDKLIKISSNNKSLLYRWLRLMSRIYKPVALFRLKHNFHYFMIEFDLWRLTVRALQRMKILT